MEENNNTEQSPELNAWEKFKLENNEPATKVEAVAQENNVEASVSEVPESSAAITTADLSASSNDTMQAVGSIANGVIGVTETPRTVKNDAPAPAKKSNKTVVIYSTKNVSWSEVGKVYRGYNVVTPEQSEKWLSRNHVRLATPEEVAKEFGR
jgi:hypothetical protein